MSIEIKDGEFILNGTPSSVVAKTLQGAGLKESAVAEIIGGWFVGVTGAAQPVPVKVTTAVEDTDPKCTVTYNRDFTHIDWIDGESRVQAGMTPEELGFNARFHAIENEFDAVATQLNRFGSCAAGIRSDLAGVVKELEAKITALQNEIHARRQEEKPPTGPKFLGTATVDDKPILITQIADEFKFVGFQEQPIRIPDLKIPVKPVDPNPDPRILLDLTAGLTHVLTAPGVEELWQAGGPVTVGDLRTSPRTATVVLPTGEALGAVLATMPANAEFDNPAVAVAEVVEHLVAGMSRETSTTVREHVVTGEAAARTGGALLSSSVASLGFDEQVTHALAAAELGTVARLANAEPTVVANALRTAGLDPAGASGVLAQAVVARAVRNVVVR
jgi:hypothetical protein